MSKYIYLKLTLFTVTLLAFAGIPMNAEAVTTTSKASLGFQTISLDNGLVHLIDRRERKKWKRERKKLKRERRKLRSERRRWRDDDYYGRGGYHNPGHAGDVLNLFGGIAGAIAGNQNRGRECAVKGTRDGYFYKPGDYGYHSERADRWFCSGRQARNNGYTRGR